MPKGESIWLLLGGNEGDVESVQESALGSIASSIGNIVAISSKHWTEPWGFEHPNQFLNRAVEVTTLLSPQKVLMAIHQIENDHGRTRAMTEGYVARPLDIDILFYGDHVIDEPHLTIPHGLLHQREFALAPLAEICPNKIHPTLHLSVVALLEDAEAERRSRPSGVRSSALK